MDQQRRFVTFFLLSMVTMYLWFNHGLPYFYPELTKRKAEKEIAAQKEADANEEDSDSDSNAAGSSSVPGEQESGDGKPAVVKSDEPVGNGSDPPAGKAEADQKAELPDYPSRAITLGALGPESNDFLQVDLVSRGAAVAALRMNDPRYRVLKNPEKPLELLGIVPGSSRVSFDMKLNWIDLQLAEYGESLETVNWKVDEESLNDHSATFEYPAPDGSFVVRKTFELQQGKPDQKDSYTDGYELLVKLEFENRKEKPIDIRYDLQGPVGFPLEDIENTRRFLSIQAGFETDGSVRHEQLLASEIAAQAAEAEGIENFRAPLRYLGVDGQYFAALVIPGVNQQQENWIEVAQPILLKVGAEKEHSLVSFVLQSNPITVAPNQTVTHEYTLFAGPKRTPLLQAYDADAIIEYGWFGWISKIMLAILHGFHEWLYLPYGIAIIMLTVIVRACMYPISRKHAMAAKRMKELQPKFEEIKKKYENDKEKLAKAQMDLMKESGFFAGCLPMILQIPIFIGLYQALYTSVDLRMAEFLWIDNLAAPDQLFQMPFSLPWLGDNFNLLPILTVALFIFQQKMFAPPPANEEQALQQKMMSYMMIFIGFMFYKVPAGLCIYFIASSLWAIAERKILDLHDTSPEKKTVEKKQPKKSQEADGKKSWLQNKLSELDAAANPSQKQPRLKPGKKGKSR